MPMTIEEILENKDSHFSVSYYSGIAFYFLKEETELVRNLDEWDYEEEMPTGNAIMIMVGDDAEHVIDPADIELIDEESFCRDCGQIGCRHNVYS